MQNNPKDENSKKPNVSKSDLNKIYKKLEDIEKKAGEKWLIPIIVAVIVGVFGLINIFIQTKLQNTSQIELVRRIKDEETLGVQDATDRNLFYQGSLSLMVKIDTDFEQVCLFEPVSVIKDGKNITEFQGEDSLVDSLEKFRLVIVIPPSSINKDTITKLESYSKFVAESLSNLHKMEYSEEQLKEQLKKSRELYNEATEALKKSRQKSSFSE